MADCQKNQRLCYQDGQHINGYAIKAREVSDQLSGIPLQIEHFFIFSEHSPHALHCFNLGSIPTIKITRQFQNFIDLLIHLESLVLKGARGLLAPPIAALSLRLESLE
jgi:hypothetical protein